MEAENPETTSEGNTLREESEEELLLQVSKLNYKNSNHVIHLSLIRYRFHT